MNILTENYREFENKRFLYLGATENAPVAEAVEAPETNKSPESTEKPEPTIDELVQGHKEKINEEIGKIEKTYDLVDDKGEPLDDSKLDDKQKEAKAKLEALKKEAHTAIEQIGKEWEEAKEPIAEDAVNPKIDDFVRRIQELNPQTDTPDATEATETTTEATEATEKTETITGLDKGKEKAFVAVIKKMVQSNIIPLPDGADLNNINTEQVQAMIGKAKVSAQIKALIDFVNQRTPEEITKMENGDFELGVDAEDELAKIFVASAKETYGSNIEDADKNEMQLIRNLKLTINGNETTLGNVFGNHLFFNLSQTCKIEAGSDGKIKITSNKGGQQEEVDVQGLAKYVSDSATFTKIVKGELSGDALTKAQDDFNTNSRNINGMLKGIQSGDPDAVFEAMTNGVPEAMKKFGIMDLIALFQMISEALQSDPPDLSILGDIAMDIQNGKSPLENIKAAKKDFEKGVDRITDTTQLLSLCNDANGATANALFPKQTRYRSALRVIARTKLAKELGVNVDTYEVMGESAKITVSGVEGSEVLLLSKETNGGLSVSRYSIETDDKGKEKITYQVGEKNKRENVAGKSMEDLKFALKLSGEAPEPTEPTTETTETTTAETDATTPEGTEKNKANAEMVRLALEKTPDEDMKKIMENLAKETKESDQLLERTRQNIAELKGKPENVNERGNLNDKGQKELDNLRRISIANGVKSGAFTIDQVRNAGVNILETEKITEPETEVAEATPENNFDKEAGEMLAKATPSKVLYLITQIPVKGNSNVLTNLMATVREGIDKEGFKITEDLAKKIIEVIKLSKKDLNFIKEQLA
ncbi:hypothetical protein JW758_01550 [Candidatus Peregrinibacteria bacterium]|nr:hypothetical protein [Candidatus Peregrinibacteria bacterium]